MRVIFVHRVKLILIYDNILHFLQYMVLLNYKEIGYVWNEK